MHPNFASINFASIFKKTALAALIVGVSAAQANSSLLAQTNASGIIVTSEQANIVRAAAQRDFAQFVQFNIQQHAGSSPPGFPLDVTDVHDLEDAKLAYGFPIYTVKPNDILAGRGDLHSMAQATGEWRFVITVHETPIGMATLKQVDGRWKITSYGAAVLAKDVDAVLALHANAERSNVRFVRIYQAESDFLEVVSPQDAHARFAPLHSARQSLLMQQRNEKSGNPSVNNGLLEQADFIEPLRAAVKSNLETFR
jgi:hypothetical protein